MKIFLPGGMVMPGKSFETDDVEGRQFVRSGAARPADDSAQQSQEPRMKRQYRRRDLTAEE